VYGQTVGADVSIDKPRSVRSDRKGFRHSWSLGKTIARLSFEVLEFSWADWFWTPQAGMHRTCHTMFPRAFMSETAPFCIRRCGRLI
jgi:hypothetical protein